MKKIFPKIGICIIAFSGVMLSYSFTNRNSVSICHAESACSPAVEYKELIIEIDEVNDKNFSTIRNSIEGAGGVFYKGYCSDLHVFMYLVNRDVQPDNSFLDKLTLLNISYVIKDGSTIQQVSDACGIDTTPNNNTNETE